MGLEVDVIFKIAGVGIVVAFCIQFSIRLERKNMPNGLHYLVLFIFCSWLHRSLMIFFKRLNQCFYSKGKGALPLKSSK